MATQSFDEMMIIDTPEKARNLEAAFREAERRGPLFPDGTDLDEEIRRGDEHLRNNPDFFVRLVEAFRERIRQNGEGQDAEEDDPVE
ncbi:MAG: hypothetical protein LBH69_03395 [Methanomassiliicoccaceae archaeon]|jgi:hypothetical protein|nr:hypothetical protein [Methanomassiliicoccaceae archaeon]